MSKEVADIQIIDAGPPVHEILELTVVEEGQLAHLWPKRKFMVLSEQAMDKKGHKQIEAVEIIPGNVSRLGSFVIDIYKNEEEKQTRYTLSDKLGT